MSNIWNGQIKWKIGQSEEHSLQCNLLCKPEDLAKSNVQNWSQNELSIRFIDRNLLTSQLKGKHDLLLNTFEKLSFIQVSEYFSHSTVLDFEFNQNQMNYQQGYNSLLQQLNPTPSPNMPRAGPHFGLVTLFQGTILDKCSKLVTVRLFSIEMKESYQR